MWGLRYIDDLVLRERDTNADGTLDERLYTLQDANWNVTAIASTAGVLTEHYRYDAYGQCAVLDASFDPLTSSAYAWEHLFTGRLRDAETGLMDYRARYYHTGLGRFVARDPIGYGGGDTNFYRYVDDSPAVRLDPLGLWSWGGFFTGVAYGVAGVAVGIGAAIVVTATAPALIAGGIAVVAAGYGGFKLGQTLYEAGSGYEWAMNGDGRPLTDYEQSARWGQGAVGVAAIAATASPWGRQGASRDGRWLRKPPGARWREDMDNITVSGDRYNSDRDVPPGERGLGLTDMDPSQWPQTAGTGLTSAGRIEGFPLGTAGSQTVKPTGDCP